MEYDRRYRDGGRVLDKEIIPYGKDYVLERRVITENVDGGRNRHARDLIEDPYVYDMETRYSHGPPLPPPPPPLVHREVYHDRPHRRRTPKCTCKRKCTCPVPVDPPVRERGCGRRDCRHASRPAFDDNGCNVYGCEYGRVDNGRSMAGAYPVGYSYTSAPTPYPEMPPIVYPAEGRFPPSYGGYPGGFSDVSSGCPCFGNRFM